MRHRISKVNCQNCAVRLSKNSPQLFCDICGNLKHAKCENLSKLEASSIANSRFSWTCHECITDILPINAHAAMTTNAKVTTNQVPRFHVKCHCCNGNSYSPRNVVQCSWCDNFVHLKCHKSDLGCISCCENLIPAYNTTLHEFNDDYSHLNNLIFNPYSREHNTYAIGEALTNEEHHNSAWSEVSQILTSCHYKQLRHVKPSNKSQLKILSLNIRSLIKCIDNIRENIDLYQKYDVLCFNETNLKFEKLPNGMNDISLEGFHDPLVRDPVRNSGIKAAV